MKSNDSEVLMRIEAQLAALDKKVDALMHSAPKSVPMDRERSAYPSRGYGEKGKMTYKAVCAQCGQTCGVPFKPEGNRPVYCSECFAKQQSDGPREREGGFHKKPRDFRKPVGAGKKPFFKKR